MAAKDKYPLIIWVNPDWAGYSTERTELANFIADEHIDGLLMVSGDAHMVTNDNGSNSDFSTSHSGGFPVLQAAALDRPRHVKGGPYSEGLHPGGGQFGVVQVTDDGGDTISVDLLGTNWKNEKIVAYQFTVPAP